MKGDFQLTIHKAIKLKPITPFHHGKMMDMESIEEFIHSDTIFSALCRISDVYMGKEEYKKLINPFLTTKPPFLISSMFPYYENGEKTIYFFPKPLLFKSFVNKNPKNIKRFKKIRFVSAEIFNAYLRGDDDFLEKQFHDKNKNPRKNLFIQGNQVWLSENERKLIPYVENLWKTHRSPRIAIDRINQNTSIYHYSRVYFNDHVGLFFLIKCLDESEEQELIKNLSIKLRYLGDSGIGGERSLGNGQFRVQLDENNSLFQISLDENIDTTDQIVSLSLFLPSDTDIKNGLLDPPSFYQIINRKGWISNSTYRRKSVFMISEGSVFNKNGHPISGRVIELTPEILKNSDSGYKIHRYGLLYPILIKNKI
ncbi:MAG: type III-A CRISPR-associated RAMP protein Csm4 [Candidatus Lokiarchaeota archaeon]|nr:type III-A CRISPR-associated RAMP protein Csm4 [Candidatus Lokiarchaeota archaeon]